MIMGLQQIPGVRELSVKRELSNKESYAILHSWKTIEPGGYPSFRRG